MFFFSRKSKHNEIGDEFADVVARLRAERPEATPLELDKIKQTALRRSRVRRGPVGSIARGGSMRRALLIALVTGSLLAGGTGAVIAGGSDSSGNNGDGAKGDKKHKSKNAGNKQYSKCKTGEVSTPDHPCRPRTCKSKQNPQTDHCVPKNTKGTKNTKKTGQSKGSKQNP